MSMHPIIRNILGTVLALGILGVSISYGMYVVQYTKTSTPAAFRTFAASGEGKVVGVPDVATFSISVVTEGDLNVTDAQSKNTQKMNDIIAYVQKSGVEKKDVQTSDYALEPRYQYFDCSSTPVPMTGNTKEVKPCPPPQISGYTVRQTVTVKVRDFSKAGTILAGVTEKGANVVSGIAFKIDDPSQVEQEARLKAIEKAKQKAQGIADAGGFALGRIISISENTSGGAQPYYADYGVRGIAESKAAAPAPSIEPGSQETSVTATITYEIVEKGK